MDDGGEDDEFNGIEFMEMSRIFLLQDAIFCETISFDRKYSHLLSLSVSMAGIKAFQQQHDIA